LNQINSSYFFFKKHSKSSFPLFLWQQTLLPLQFSPSFSLVETWKLEQSSIPPPPSFRDLSFPVAHHFKPHLNLLLFSFSFCQSWILLLEQGRVRLRVQFWRHTFMQEWLIHLSFSLSCKGYYSEGVLILNLLLRWMNIIFHREKNIYLACSKAPRYD
jgi:hypothetical protein